MRIIFSSIIIIHGLIHLLGFVKAFGLSDAKQLTQNISKFFGVVWLLTALVFLITVLLFTFKNSYWWIFGIIAIVISQTLIICLWQDAKSGTTVNVTILVACIIGFSTWSYYSKYQDEVNIGLQKNQNIENPFLTEADITQLPEPIKKYLRNTGSLGKPKVNNFNVELLGKIRKNEPSEWMLFTSEQYNFMEIQTRLFFMKAVMKHLPVAGFHSYINGDACMDIRLLSLFKVQYQDGEEMNEAETVTFFNDMCCMAPATLIDKRISWQLISEKAVKATFTNNGISINADLFFNDARELINFKSDDRYNAGAGKKLPWATPLSDYKVVNGFKLARHAEAIYNYPDRELCYATFEVSSIKYNCKNIK